MSQEKYTFHVSGMHCKSCVVMIESELKEQPNIIKAKSSLKKNSVEIEGDFGSKDAVVIAEELTNILKKHGYTVTVEKHATNKNWAEFRIAIPIAILFGVLFFLLQKTGLVNLVGAGKITYGTSFVIGIIASLSSCMAVVGGLVLSMSATFAKEGDKTRPQIMFHIGRLVSFFILGGVIGLAGSAFTLGVTGTVVLGVIVGLVMLILGINLLDVFPIAKHLQLTMPKFLSKHAIGISKLNHSITPLLVGIATFFLPCGFTQSMQIYSLTTGSYMSGALTMFAFALGTLPVLAILSFSSFSIQNNKHRGVFFKSAGLIVILFAIFNLINSLVVAGLISPIFNF